MSDRSEWMTLAPAPKALAQGKKWHVFLSYRSVNRRWVLALYDVLRQLQYQVFLDQYVLKPTDNLILALGEGLGESAAGVLVWSAAAEDSEWCKKEYASMESREHRGDGFRYAVIKLDQQEPPDFAREKLYIDFSGHRDGPCGTPLLRLAYGIHGQPLSDAAIQLGQQVDDETREAMIALRAAQKIGDRERILELAARDTPAWRLSPTLGCQAAESLIALKANSEALALLEKLKTNFPLSIRRRQLLGLALARSKRLADAQQILSELHEAGERDPETLGIFARTWDDRYKETQNSLFLRKSRDLYLQAFRGAPSDYYTGLNAAAKSVFLGESDKADELLPALEKLVGTAVTQNDYWKSASAAEVQLMKRAFAGAADLYAAAVADAPTERGSHEATWEQAQRLMDKLQPSPAERARVAAAFAHLAEPQGAPAPGGP